MENIRFFKMNNEITFKKFENLNFHVMSRLQEIWFKEYSLDSRKPREKLFEEFKEKWLIEELLETIPIVFKLFNQHRIINFNKNPEKFEKSKEDIAELWKDFKIEWDFYSEESTSMFNEIANLSQGMFDEWVAKYTFEAPEVYEETLKFDKNKPKIQLWKEFKEIWEIGWFHNELKYNELLMELEDDIATDIYKRKMWELYHDKKYYNYCLLKKYKIWCDFLDEILKR